MRLPVLAINITVDLEKLQATLQTAGNLRSSDPCAVKRWQAQ